MAKIESIHLYRVQFSESEMSALRNMMQYYEDYADVDSETSARVRREFGISPSPEVSGSPVDEDFNDGEPDTPNEQETLPERAIRVASGQRTPRQGQRKSRLTDNE